MGISIYGRTYGYLYTAIIVGLVRGEGGENLENKLLMAGVAATPAQQVGLFKHMSSVYRVERVGGGFLGNMIFIAGMAAASSLPMQCLFSHVERSEEGPKWGGGSGGG
jgi:hypothetical protein